MNYIRVFPTVLICWLLFAGSSIRADEVSPKKLPTPVQLQQRDEYTQKLSTARRLISAKQYQPASDLLETLLERNANNGVVLSLLRSCYMSLKQYSKAEALSRRVVENNPRNVPHWIYLAEVLSEQSKWEDASIAYDQALSQMSLFNIGPYSRIVNSMRSHGLEQRALELIDSARVITGDALLFSIERGKVLEAQQMYGDAAREYLPVLAQDTVREAAEAERRLLAMLSFETSLPDVRQVLIGEGENLSGQRAVRLLATHYLKSGLLDEAFSFSVRQDSLEGNSGTALIRYMRECKERKLWPPLVRMAEFTLENTSSLSLETQVRFYYGGALTATGKYERGIASYQRLIETAVNSLDSGDAIYAIGNIYLEHLGQYERALEQFKTVVESHRRGHGYIRARVSIPKCYLRAGDLQLARSAFKVLSQQVSLDEIGEEADYYLSLIALFAKQYDSAAAGLRKLVVDYPRGFYVNDALQLIVLLSESANDTVLLYDYSNALFFKEQRQPDSSRLYLKQVASAENSALADIALLRLAELEIARADTGSALLALDKLITDFPDSYYFPYGMKMKADILAESRLDSAEAERLYRYLLENYPDYPFITEVRKKLRSPHMSESIG